MNRVVLDTNVFVSGLVFGGKSRIILEMAEDGAFELAVSEFIRVELEGILQQKFGWSQERVAWGCRPIWNVARDIIPRVTIAVCSDPDDNRILECALEAEASVIVTGDSDLLRLNPYEEIAIVSPAAFLQQYTGKRLP